jgi:hypothetical protein
VTFFCELASNNTLLRLLSLESSSAASLPTAFANQRFAFASIEPEYACACFNRLIGDPPSTT